MYKFFRQPTLLCFSPPVMVATIGIELALALWVLVRYASSTTQRLIVALLLCLAAFQVAEFNVCRLALDASFWPRFGYIFITLLPPLGLHLIVHLRRESRPKLLAASYAIGSVFGGAFAFMSTGLDRGVCTGNYVIFMLSQPFSYLYMLYYTVLVLVAIGLCLLSVSSKSKNRSSLTWLLAGYLAFSIPTLVINYILPSTQTAIPSIMCGFAVILALILGLKVAPLTLKQSPILVPTHNKQPSK